jgi:hypothetical protein
MNELHQAIVEPPETQFLIGRDSLGNWVVQDRRHSCGGLFVDRAEALLYALLANGRRPRAVLMVPGVFELDLHVGDDAPLARAA